MILKEVMLTQHSLEGLLSFGTKCV